jgi:hypothetical protein
MIDVYCPWFGIHTPVYRGGRFLSLHYPQLDTPPHYSESGHLAAHNTGPLNITQLRLMLTRNYHCGPIRYEPCRLHAVADICSERLITTGPHDLFGRSATHSSLVLDITSAMTRNSPGHYRLLAPRRKLRLARFHLLELHDGQSSNSYYKQTVGPKLLTDL